MYSIYKNNTPDKNHVIHDEAKTPGRLLRVLLSLIYHSLTFSNGFKIPNLSSLILSKIEYYRNIQYDTNTIQCIFLYSDTSPPQPFARKVRRKKLSSIYIASNSIKI